MITIRSTADDLSDISIGSHVEFIIEPQAPTIEVRCFLAHEGVLYPRPITDWSSLRSLPLFPEAPGAYRLFINWRTSEQTQGWQDVCFQVNAPNPTTPSPVQLPLDADTVVWSPSVWESTLLGGWEHPLTTVIPSLLNLGDVVYDIGANLGLFSILFSRLVGDGGMVYGIEANPVCVQFLRANLAQNNVSSNVMIIPVAISDSEGSHRFAINYGNSNLGVVEDSSLYASKVGHEICVTCACLDELIGELGLRPPNLIKIDIEGAEDVAIKGMHQCLTRYSPVLVLELHGAGPAQRTLNQLDSLGYCFTIPGYPNELLSGAEVLAKTGDKVFQVVAQSAKGSPVPG